MLAHPKIFDTDETATDFFKGGSALTIGNYDGVHLGHRAIIAKLVMEAAKRGLKPGCVTFDPHPVKVLAPAVAPKLITTLTQKTGLLTALGVSVVVKKFDAAFAHTSPQDFFRQFLAKELNAKYILVGYDFTFGAHRTGTIETLEKLGRESGVAVELMPAHMNGETLVSSTLIRKLICEGDVRLAGKFMNRPYSIDGTVIHGKNRGTALGLHTANLDVDNELLPLDGVYATVATLNGRRFDSVTNIGFNPTFDNTERSVETHILGFDQDIYGKTTQLTFVERLRAEIRFVSPEALVRQIAKDIENASAVLRREPLQGEKT